jgi:hypothetical protein
MIRDVRSGKVRDIAQAEETVDQLAQLIGNH